MTLDDLKAEWKKDCEIDDIELDKSSLEVPKLHAKYSEYLTDAVVRHKNLQLKYSMLLKDKWLWFNGKMDEETIKEKGWSDDPFDGLKIMKNDMNTLLAEIKSMSPDDRARLLKAAKEKYSTGMKAKDTLRIEADVVV